MTTVGDHVRAVDDAMCQNIASLADQRDLLSQNILAQLRNLVEGAAALLEAGAPDATYDYDAIQSGLAHVRARGQYAFLTRFHRLLQVSASHYTVDGDASERLMLRYYEYLLRLRSLLTDVCGIQVLANLESFPIDLDPSLREYHEKIAARIEALHSSDSESGSRARYYVHATRPFFAGGRVYYEVTFNHAINRVSKSERIIAFTEIDMTDAYSAMLTLQSDEIDVLGQVMPITVIRDWEVSIRPCEFNNFARLLGIAISTRTDSAEYRYLMRGLTAGRGSLLDLIDLPDARYAETRTAGTAGVTKPQLFPVLDAARKLVRGAGPGHNLLRYLLLRMRNDVLRKQHDWSGCARLSDLKVKYGCIPFDTMPFCSSLVGHNPRYWDLVESIDASGRSHELLARRVRNNIEQNGILYTPTSELETFGDVTQLIATYNRALYYTHAGRQLVQDKGHVVIREYEDGTVAIVEKLQECAAAGIDDYTTDVDAWLDADPWIVDDDVKKDALRNLFSESRVALIYGAAGTGKSTMVNHIAGLFDDEEKLFLAHTHPAVDNLRRRVTVTHNATFRTISSHIRKTGIDPEYGVVVIDECSTVSNADLIKVLERTGFTLLVLVGDEYQIESIRFGNWFSLVRAFLPASCVFELTTPFRTKNKSLRLFWDKVRNLDDDLVEVLTHNGYSTTLDRSLFDPQRDDEIVLCLNYDGLYGINNVNRFLQSCNTSPAVDWRAATYKVGDPVLFNDIGRFAPVIYNNLKGRIVGIDVAPGTIEFDVELDGEVDEDDVDGDDLVWLGGSTVRFSVFDYDTSDDDDDSPLTTVPFQVAYAVSIHKAQGLEYDSVKVVITGANEDRVTHSIFYTAVTRARESLKIFWTPETQNKVLGSLVRDTSRKDAKLLATRCGLTPPSALRAR